MEDALDSRRAGNGTSAFTAAEGLRLARVAAVDIGTAVDDPVTAVVIDAVVDDDDDDEGRTVKGWNGGSGTDSGSSPIDVARCSNTHSHTFIPEQ
jgi:hypothetical protein